MNPVVLSEVAIAISVAAFVSGVLISSHVIDVANEVKAKVESVVAKIESKAEAVEHDILG